MTDKKALVRLYMLQLSNEALLYSISFKIKGVFQVLGMTDEGVDQVEKHARMMHQEILKQSLERWKPFLEELADGEDLSDIKLEDLIG